MWIVDVFFVVEAKWRNIYKSINAWKTKFAPVAFLLNARWPLCSPYLMNKEDFGAGVETNSDCGSHSSVHTWDTKVNECDGNVIIWGHIIGQRPTQFNSSCQISAEDL